MQQLSGMIFEILLTLKSIMNATSSIFILLELKVFMAYLSLKPHNVLYINGLATGFPGDPFKEEVLPFWNWPPPPHKKNTRAARSATPPPQSLSIPSQNTKSYRKHWAIWHGLPHITHIKVNNDHKSAFEFDELKFFSAYPSLKPHIRGVTFGEKDTWYKFCVDT